jgi:hypothetical protein
MRSSWPFNPQLIPGPKASSPERVKQSAQLLSSARSMQTLEDTFLDLVPGENSKMFFAQATANARGAADLFLVPDEGATRA